MNLCRPLKAVVNTLAGSIPCASHTRRGLPSRHVVLYLLGPLVVAIGVSAAVFMIVQGCKHVLPCVLCDAFLQTCRHLRRQVQLYPGDSPNSARFLARHKNPSWWGLHLVCMGVLALNFVFNYYHAITQDPGSTASPAYSKTLQAARDVGLVTGVDYDEQRAQGSVER